MGWRASDVAVPIATTGPINAEAPIGIARPIDSRMPVSTVKPIDIAVPVTVRWPAKGFVVIDTGVHIPAGFPSPAADHVEDEIDLEAYLVRHQLATRWMRVGGDSLVDLGVHEGDFVAVDRAARKRIGQIVLALVDGEFTLKQLARQGQPPNATYWLVSANREKDYPAIQLREGDAIEGVVCGVVRRYEVE